MKHLLDARSEAIEIVGATHEVHRSRFDDFMGAVRRFTAASAVPVAVLVSA